MKSVILHLFLITFVCNPIGFVDSFSLWGYFKDDNSKERMLVEQGQGILVQYEGKNDCFKEASVAIRTKCTELENRSDDQEKIKFAIQLTLCQLEIAKFETPRECKNVDYSGDCVAALGKVSQFWTTYIGFYREVVQMCFSTRYSIEIDLLSQFSKNITNTYSNIIRDLNIIITSFRDEEKERLPRITNSLYEIVNDIETLKSKSSSVSSEMEMFKETIKTFQSKISNALSQVTTLNENLNNVVPYVDRIFDELNKNKNKYINSINENLVTTENLSISNIKTLNIIKETLFGIEEFTSNSLSDHQTLRKSVGEVKQEIEELISFSKNEIKEFSSYSQNEIKNFTKSIDSITQTFNMIYEFAIIFKKFKKWIFIIPSVISVLFVYRSFNILGLIGDITSLILILYENKTVHGYEIYTHFIAMFIGFFLSKYMECNNKYVFNASVIMKFINITMAIIGN